MSKKKASFISLGQIEEALEERVKPDRRQADKGLPEHVSNERRKGDRREQKPSKTD